MGLKKTEFDIIYFFSFQDKSKIRHKKRWSQCMYMYYLLGHRLMELPISVDRKEVRIWKFDECIIWKA